jgi:hypothetical protein
MTSMSLPDQREIRPTRIGDLVYEAGFPTRETVRKLYDELDFQRAVLAYQYASRWWRSMSSTSGSNSSAWMKAT